MLLISHSLLSPLSPFNPIYSNLHYMQPVDNDPLDSLIESMLLSPKINDLFFKLFTSDDSRLEKDLDDYVRLHKDVNRDDIINTLLGSKAAAYHEFIKNKKSTKKSVEQRVKPTVVADVVSRLNQELEDELAKRNVDKHTIRFKWPVNRLDENIHSYTFKFPFQLNDSAEIDSKEAEVTDDDTFSNLFVSWDIINELIHSKKEEKSSKEEITEKTNVKEEEVKMFNPIKQHTTQAEEIDVEIIRKKLQRRFPSIDFSKAADAFLKLHAQVNNIV